VACLQSRHCAAVSAHFSGEHMLQHGATRGKTPAMRGAQSRRQEAAMTDEKRKSCELERHRHTPRQMQRDGALQRSRCCYCGCTLVRTAATRKWYRSGMMG